MADPEGSADDVFMPGGRLRLDLLDDSAAEAVRESVRLAKETRWDCVRSPHVFMGLLVFTSVTGGFMGLLGDRIRGRDVAIGGTGQSDEIAAALGPLAGRGGADYGQAGIDRRALESGLDEPKVGLHAFPLEAIVGITGGGVRTVGRKRSIVYLAVGKIGHGRYVEQAAIVGRMAAERSIGGVGVG